MLSVNRIFLRDQLSFYMHVLTILLVLIPNRNNGGNYLLWLRRKICFHFLTWHIKVLLQVFSNIMYLLSIYM